MKRALVVLGLTILATLNVWPQTKTPASKTHEVLSLYEKFLGVDERVHRLEKESKELQKELNSFLESDSPLNQLTGAAMLVGALKAWIPQSKDLLTEEDSLITKLVTTSTGLTGDAGRYADEGVRLLREQQVYLKQGLDKAEKLAASMVDLLRSVREDRVADLARSEERRVGKECRL